MPGEEFSYNKVIKDTTPENGYKEANTYVGSEVVPNYGGGDVKYQHSFIELL